MTETNETVAPELNDSEDSGLYRVVEPVEGLEPEEVSFVIDGTRYTYHDYVGKEYSSRVIPEVLCYKEREVFEVE